jgi:hypothetical protein
VKGSWGNDDLNFLWVKREFVKNIGWESLGESDVSIAFPVSSDH